ncbi:MAG TPA: preprotein translocase subunit SecE [Solirubrobacteraceae bacterium]|nr:preprotein translocase subunit SecE [Solirubrobacteraceae bacterium]
MARDRKRARQRRSRPVREGASAPSQNRPVRADLPGALSHAGDVDEFDAALIRGAEGVPLEQETQPEQNGEGSLEAPPAGVASGGAGRGGRRGGGESAEVALGDDDGAAPESEVAPLARRPSQPINRRAAAFLRASWAELQRVQWPDRRQVTQATTVVLGFVAVAGVYLGAADWAAQKIVNFIL